MVLYPGGEPGWLASLSAPGHPQAGRSLFYHQELIMPDLIEEQIRVSMKSKEHLKDWLKKTGREFIVFNAQDLVDSLSWPDGVEGLQAILFAYREHRRQIPTGEMEIVEVDGERADGEKVVGEKVEVPKMKDESLTDAEARKAVNQIVPGAAGLVWPDPLPVDES